VSFSLSFKCIYRYSFYNLSRRRNKAAAAVPKKCPCFAQVLGRLVPALMLIAAIIVPIIIGLTGSTTTSKISHSFVLMVVLINYLAVTTSTTTVSKCLNSTNITE
jgi:MFS superfamily sulfate permease-like transporter